MKKVFLLLLLVLSTTVFGTNTLYDKVKRTEKQCDKSVAKCPNRYEKQIASKTSNPIKEKNLVSSSNLLKVFTLKAEENAKQRLDSCIARDKNEKVFAKDYYYYYPLGAWPNGALKSIEMYSLDEETNQWLGWRATSTYDEYGNSNYKLIEATHDGVWTPELKYIANYTSFGELTLDEVYIYENEEWVGDSKRTTTYDSQNRKLLEEVFTWNKSTKAWDNYQRIEQTYEATQKTELVKEWNDSQWLPSTYMVDTTDDNGNTIKMEISEWSLENNDWKVTLRVENVYDSEGNITLMTSYNYNETSAELLPNAKEVYTYGQNQKTQESYGYNYETNEWDGISKIVERFENDLIVESVYSAWAAESESWIYESRALHQYNPEGLPIQTNTQIWDGTTWQENQKTEIQYNQYGHESHNASYSYANGEWIKESELIQETDKEGRITLLEGYRIDPETNQWGGADIKEIHEYNENGLDMYDEFYTWNWDTNDWELDERADYFYSEAGSSIRNTDKAGGVTVYAANGKVVITDGENELLYIYTLDGSLIHSTIVYGNNYPVSLPKGLYLVRVKEQSFKVNVQ